MSDSSVCRRLKTVPQINRLTCVTLVICIAASSGYVSAAQKIGDTCILKSGVFGACQLLSQCASAVEKAFHGESLIFCSFNSNEPVVCCQEVVEFKLQPEDRQNILTRQRHPQRHPDFTNEYFVFDGVPSDADYYTMYARRDREAPWWFNDRPFTTSGHKPTATSSTNRPNRRERPNSPDQPWWWSGDDRPFSVSSSTRQPPNPPAPTVPETPKPIRRPPSSSQRPQTSANDGLSVSERKCKEYSERVTTQISALPLVPSPEPIHIDVPKCDFNKVPLIVGGEKTKPKEFPHMAALGYVENGQIHWRCGGSLISDLYVLTAAHCALPSTQPTYARLGDLNLKRSDDDAAPVNYLIDKIIRHPQYKASAKYNDIALLKLDRSVKFSDYIRPACLYTRDTFDVNKTVATGWGKIAYAEKESDDLLKVVINIIPNKLCNELYQMDGDTRELKDGIVSSMVCAGDLTGKRDTCKGDSGGPIQITRPSNQCIFRVIGVTSFGKFCAAENSPGVYTRVSSFVPWIESVVWPDGV